MASFYDYKIIEFLIEARDPVKGTEKFIDFSTAVSSIAYSESVTSPMSRVTLVLVNTNGLLSKIKIRGGEKVRLVIEHPGTKTKLNLTDDNDNTYYISSIINSSTESTRETFIAELVPKECFTNETTTLHKRYPAKGTTTLESSVKNILQNELKTTRYLEQNIEKTYNNYTFMGNMKKPFTVLGWLCPKAIPVKGGSGNETGTAGYLFFENKNGYNFKSIDSLFDSGNEPIANYSYVETRGEPGDPQANFHLVSPPLATKNVNIEENLRIGMYSSINYFFDLNTRKFYKNTYKLKESFDIMSHAGDDVSPILTEDLENSPSRVMVSMLDNGQMDISGQLVDNVDKRMEYQAQSVTRYNLLFSQSLNITVPLNLNLSVGEIIFLNFGEITTDEERKGLKDKSKSGKYLISKLKHSFGDKGLTGLQLVRDSYGVA